MLGQDSRAKKITDDADRRAKIKKGRRIFERIRDGQDGEEGGSGIRSVWEKTRQVVRIDYHCDGCD